MESDDVYTALNRIVSRPAPFAVYTADALWTDAHTSERMLAFHLDPDVDVASRRADFIDESVRWMVGHFALSDRSRILDLGCGPGLYASRLAAAGTDVTGVDFSPTSIAYAREQAESSGQSIVYHQANYLEYEPAGTYDLITMIMCDFCALGPAQRSGLLHKFARSLSGNGRLVLDVYSLAAFAHKQEVVLFEKNLLDGFWSASAYYGFLASFKYDEERVSLDKYTIIEASRSREVYNWLQYYSPESLGQELSDHGLACESLLGNVAGHSYDPRGTEFAVVAKKV